MNARILIGATAALAVALGAQGATYTPEVKTALDALGLRDEIVVVRADTSDGDREPLFLAQGLHIPPTYFRAGEQQCMDKMANVVACSDESGDPAEAQGIRFDPEPETAASVAASLPDWAGTPVPTVRDGSEIWVVIPAPPKFPDSQQAVSPVSLAASRWYLGGVVAAVVVSAGVVSTIRRKG